MQFLAASACAISSLISPIWLGVIVGALSSGRIVGVSASAWDTFFAPWMAMFPFAVGMFALSLFAFLAAVYLTVESHGPLRQDFRVRALVAGAAVAGLALLVFFLAGAGAPEIRQRLVGSWWSWPLQTATALSAVGAWYGIWAQRFKLARVCTILQVSLIFGGWALSQYPFLVLPTLTIQNAAAPAVTLRLLVIAVAAGATVLLPSFYYLFRIFRGQGGVTDPH